MYIGCTLGQLRAIVIIALFGIAMACTQAHRAFADDTNVITVEVVHQVIVGNYEVQSPCGISWIIDNSAAFTLDTAGPYTAGISAPDNSYHEYHFVLNGANVVFTWGKFGANAYGKLTTDKAMDLNLNLSSGWPDLKSTFVGATDGAVGSATMPGGSVTWTLRTLPLPKSSTGSTVTISISPDSPLRFVAGLTAMPPSKVLNGPVSLKRLIEPAILLSWDGTSNDAVDAPTPLPSLETIDSTLAKAKADYLSSRPSADGEWGDFVGAIADNMNNSRIYSSDNQTVAHSVSRSWAQGNPNADPYFCWDSFFTANLAAIDDPTVARNTVLAMLSHQTPSGLVPNYGHWSVNNPTDSDDRSQPPMASLNIWKIHERYPDDHVFLSKVYPKLVLWHEWFPKYRDGRHDGLLEWGSNSGDWQNAQFETGWDDNLHFAGTKMIGNTMDAYAVDLCSMWSMDCKYLSLIADLLGHPADAHKFRLERLEMNQRINAHLWNPALNCYCSKYWDGAVADLPLQSSAFGAGFDGQYFSDVNLQTPVATDHQTALNFNWNGQSPIAAVAASNWSARWKATLTPPTTAVYTITATADDGVRVFVGGTKVIDDWSEHGARPATGQVTLTAGEAVPFVIEYFQASGGSSLNLSITMAVKVPDNQLFLTKLTPMNFYPLIAGVPDEDRAEKTMAVLTDPKKFWGRYLLPTLAYDDPDYPQQEYWRGDVWGPVNYIVWQGLKQYGTPTQINEFVDRSVQLFMQNWQTGLLCGENYLSTNGTQNHDPHYTWGALLSLIGLESIVDVDDSGEIVLNGNQTRDITLKNIPILGKLYYVTTTPGSAALSYHGVVVLTATGEVVKKLIP